MPNPYQQLITHWERSTPDGYGGYVYLPPQVYFARWEDKQEQFLTSTGELSMSRAVVRIPTSKADSLHVGDYVLLGESTETSPTSLDGAYPIKAVVKIPDLRLVRSENRVVL